MNKPKNWYEVWANNTTDPPYLLIVRHLKTEHAVIDPKEENRVIFRSATYESAKLWLLEDEYVLVRGRMDFDEE